MENIFIEKLILKTLMENKQFFSILSSVITENLFENFECSIIWNKFNKHFKDFKEILDKEIFENQLEDDSNKKEVLQTFEEIKLLDIDVLKNYEYIFKETNNWIQKNSLKNAILESANIINTNNNYEKIESLIKNALSKNLEFDVGLDYFGTLKERLTNIMNEEVIKYPSYFFSLDEIINGGFEPKTLSIAIARTNVGKTLFMQSLASRQILNGKNVVFFSLEMSEKMLAQRFDSIYSGLDINRIYVDKKIELTKSLKEIKSIENRGELFIKEFPTKSASIANFRHYLKKLQLSGKKIDFIFVDYLNLMKAMNTKNNIDDWEEIKQITEETRGLSFEFNCPIFSVAQFNRTGSKIDFVEADETDIGGAYAIAQTVDFAMTLGKNIDSLIYENQLHYKIVKNRFGGRLGDLGSFYVDPKSLKYYDSTELDLWMDDAIKSGCNERKIFEKQYNIKKQFNKK